jgi:hypothetical protein
MAPSDAIKQYRKHLNLLLNIQMLICIEGKKEFLLAERERLKSQLNELRMNIIS